MPSLNALSSHISLRALSASLSEPGEFTIFNTRDWNGCIDSGSSLSGASPNAAPATLSGISFFSNCLIGPKLNAGSFGDETGLSTDVEF